MYSVKASIRELTALLVAHHIREVIVCPGSRNAPLAHTFASCPDLHCTPVIDERSAAFTAIGLAEALQEPVAVCCTSGSALLDMAPAASEALYQRIPLLIISADRPACWIGQMDGQTIVQAGSLHTTVKREVTLPEPHDEESLWYANRLINEALLDLTDGCPGPVHINVPLSEPLFDMSAPDLPRVRVIKKDGVSHARLSAEMLAEWRRARRPLIILGQMLPRHTLAPALTTLCQKGAIVFAEHLANLGAIRFTPGFVGLAESILASPDLAPGNRTGNGPGNMTGYGPGNGPVNGPGNGPENGEASPAGLLAPDFVLMAGGHIVTKRLKQYLRRIKPETVWHITPDGKVADLFKCLTRVIEAAPENILPALATEDRTETDAAYRKAWMEREARARDGIARWKQDTFTDLAVLRTFLERLPKGTALQLANSSPVRNAQFFRLPEDTDVLCNRGVNGIDGSLSVATGYAMGTDRITYSLIGDLSFFYDQNALWKEHVPDNFRVLLFNNGGGGIFHLLPGLDSEHRNRFIAGSNRMTAREAAHAANLSYLTAATFAELDAALASFLDCSRKTPMLLEVTTDIEACADDSRRLTRAASSD